MNLRIPGPTPLPQDVIDAVGQQMINHRGPEFESMFREVTAGLKTFFETNNDLCILTSSGTGSMEAAVVNTLSPGDRVLAVPIGVFGELGGVGRQRQFAERTAFQMAAERFEQGHDPAPNQRFAAGQSYFTDPCLYRKVHEVKHFFIGKDFAVRQKIDSLFRHTVKAS